MNQYKLILAVVLAASLAACDSTRTLPDPEPADETYGSAGSGADTGGYDDGSMGEGEYLDSDFDAGELSHVIYFEFDSSDLGPEYTDIVQRHAMQMANNPRARVRLEGHADERGSREYNIGLGERRSQTIRRMLLIQGASASQIQTVSFGEERPASFGSTEQDYALNRRVEIVYIN